MLFVYKDGSTVKVTKSALFDIIKKEQDKVQAEHYK